MGAYEDICNDIILVGKEMYAKGMIVGTDGNMSARLPDGNIMITGSGFCKGKLQPENMTVVSLDGTIISGPKPARDIRMHLAVYRAREDARAVVHAHPPVVTGISMTRFDVSKVALPEAMFNLNGIAFTEYAVPISVDVARGVTRALEKNPGCEALILANHGATTFGQDLFSAFYKMETLEFYAKATIVSQLLGDVHYLDTEEMNTLNLLLAGVNPDEIVPPDENGL